jgi:hypothetical protein
MLADRATPHESVDARSGSRAAPREVMLAVAPPPRPDNTTLSGWPRWLTPTYLVRGATSRAQRRLPDEGESSSSSV